MENWKQTCSLWVPIRQAIFNFQFSIAHTLPHRRRAAFLSARYFLGGFAHRKPKIRFICTKNRTVLYKNQLFCTTFVFCKLKTYKSLNYWIRLFYFLKKFIFVRLSKILRELTFSKIFFSYLFCYPCILLLWSAAPFHLGVRGFLFFVEKISAKF